VVSWIFTAGSAGFAFLLSFLVGLVSGVGFGSLLLRALLSSLVFALLAVGTEMLFRTLFPELLPAANGPAPEASGEDEAQDGDESAGQTGAAVDITLDDEKELDESGAFVEEIHGAAPGTADLDEDVEDLEEIETVESVESMDELPSLDGFSDSFESDYGDEKGTGPSEPVHSPDVDVLGSTQSADEVAKAVKTMMKRDQKG
jgi:hypothetical protein